MGSATPLILVGMHRSGTSLVSSLLQSSGLHIGENLLGEGEGNVKGHFENIDFYEFHQAVLQSQGVSEHGWTLQEEIAVEESFVQRAHQLIAANAVSPYWGWKDPRTTLFLDFWLDLLPDAKFLLVYRSPWEVADSLYRRGTDDIFMRQPDLAIKVWIHYNLKLRNFYDRLAERCLLVNVRSIVENPQGYIDAVNHQFKTDLSVPDDNLYDPSLFNTQDADNYRPTLINQYFPEAIALYQELEDRRWHLHEEKAFAWQELIVEYPYKSQIFSDWQTGSYLTKQAKKAQGELNQAKEELSDIKSACKRVNLKLESIQEQLETASSQEFKKPAFVKRLLNAIEQMKKQVAFSQETIPTIQVKLMMWSKGILHYTNK